MAIILQTDFAWPDVSIERAVIEAAGHRFVSGPSTPGSAMDIEALVERYAPEAIMTCWAEISGAAIRQARQLRIVQRIGVGLDNIDIVSASAQGVWVANVPDYCVEEVSDHAIALLLDWARGTVAYDRGVKQGLWEPSTARLRRVASLTIGIIGLGRIGQRTAQKLTGFGCTVLAHGRTTPAVAGVTAESFARLLQKSDVVILHAPYSDDTHHLIGARALGLMRPGAFLINVSRGGLVDTAALQVALESGHLSGAGLDVIEGEPHPPRRLVERSDVIVTPHVAFSSDASLAELRRRAAEEVVRVLAGDPPLNPCNRPKEIP